MTSELRYFPTSWLPEIPPEDKEKERVFRNEMDKLLLRLCTEYPIHRAVQLGDYSVYTGAAGVAYTYWFLSTACSCFEDVEKNILIGNAHDYIEAALMMVNQSNDDMPRRRKSSSTFMTGAAGVYTVAAVINATLNTIHSSEPYVNQVLALAPTLKNTKGQPSELLYGYCGYLSCLLFLKRHGALEIVSGNIVYELVTDIVRAVLQNGKELSGVYKVKDRSGEVKNVYFPLMWEWHGKKYLGSAHGVSGILTVLLSLREHVVALGYDLSLKDTLGSLLQTQYLSGNFPSSIGSQSDKLVHWCHGSTGFIPLLDLASKIYKNDKSVYEQATERAVADISSRGLLKKGFGICHGISGSAFALMRKGNISNAIKFALFCCEPACIDSDTLVQQLLETPDRPFSLMEGYCGLLCLLGTLVSDQCALQQHLGYGCPWLL